MNNTPPNQPTPNTNAQPNAAAISYAFRTFQPTKPVQLSEVKIQATVPHRLWNDRQPVSPTDIGFITTRDTYGWMHCMSAHPVDWEGIRFPSAEHLFQWLRFSAYPEVQDEIFKQKSPLPAKWVAAKHKEKLGRNRWWDQHDEDIERMRRVLRAKIAQHPDLAAKLKATEQAVLVEDCTHRDRESARFWGAVKAFGRWHGSNVLGCLWMELRDTLP